MFHKDMNVTNTTTHIIIIEMVHVMSGITFIAEIDLIISLLTHIAVQ